MIPAFIAAYNAKKDALQGKFAAKHPEDYAEVVRNVVEILTTDEYDGIDPERIHSIDDGDYQGTLLFVIAAKGYQPSRYWYVKVGYGSCSGCDTLQGIRNYEDTPPNEEQVRDYMTLALHIVQGLKEMGDSDA